MRQAVRGAAAAVISKATTKIFRVPKPSTSVSPPACRFLRSSPVEPSSLLYQTMLGMRFESGSRWSFDHSSLLPAMLLMGAFGAGSIQTSYADASEEDQYRPSVTHSATNSDEVKKMASEERQRLEELLRIKKMEHGSYPHYYLSVKGQKVTLKFQVPPSCEWSHLIVDIVKNLGFSPETNGGGAEMLLRAWDSEIEDSILLALQRPEVYDDIARGTRCKFESNRPRAVLFEGPPGTGKTSSARVIAKQAGVPLLYVPLEVIMSKYYGESERLLGNVFSLANELQNGAIIFLDEVDSFATSRESDIHEATRRILSVLLRQIDGFEQETQVVIIAATNRRQDLDPALISRFDSTIMFSLPDLQTRIEIAAQYAKHLLKTELLQLASATEGMSGRDIRDVCQQAERHWASKVIRGQAPKNDEGTTLKLPPIEEYIRCAEKRREALSAATPSGSQISRFMWKPSALA